MRCGSVRSLLKQTYEEWSHDQIPRLAAALAYYTAFSIAPVLVVVIAVAGLAFGAAKVQTAIIDQLRGLLGEQGASLVGTMIASALRPRDSRLAMLLGLGAVLLGASGLFAQLQDALNTVWEVKPRPGRGVWGMLKDRGVSFAMVLAVGFFLLVTLVVSAALAGLRGFVDARLGGAAFVLTTLGLVADFALTTLLIGLLLKYLPDVRLRWRHVLPGAAVTSLLFAVGKLAIGAYLGRAAVGSAFGAAGSLAIVLLWVYYSAQILLLGAELTQVWTRRQGASIEAKPNAESHRRPEGKCAPVPAAARAEPALVAESR
ncbi:MAG: ribonuclease BN [Acidobacteria bacterium]|nr:MAG: ribonuclease BN [Acidobacteriota bacterium]